MLNNVSRRDALKLGGGLAATLGLAACGGTSTTTDDAASSVADDAASSAADSASSASDGKTYKIGVLQLTQHSALDLANTGFIRALDEYGLQYEADQVNANNEQTTCQTAASQFVGDGVDLIYCIATTAAQACLAATTEIPIVGSAITDYAESGLVADNDAPGGNVTGTSDMNPVDDQIDMLVKVLPEAKTVGMLYCSAESNSEIQVEMAEAACEAAGLETKRFTVSSSADVQSVVESMAGQVDVGYAPTDNTIAAAAAQIGQIAKDIQLPFITGEESMCEGMGICTLSVDYEQLGYMAGNMAIDILVNGADPATMPIQTEDASQLALIKNEDMAEALGIDLSVLDE